MIQKIKGREPIIDDSAFVHEMATVIGDVLIGEESNIWPFAVLRGDIERITIGKRVSIQDGSILHTDPGFPTFVDDGCTVGHGCILHGCHVGRGTLVGMGAIILTGAKIGEGCIIGAGALIPEGKEIPKESVVIGVPAKVVRAVEERDRERMKRTSEAYLALMKEYIENYKIKSK
ncbi:MAG: gamma carbonic anhydrase family protein [Candidatus Methanomethyliales bacterium]|nr:gamma carbonic anhydrase family protein [Candidatus Methanomethylicales archaeon]